MKSRSLIVTTISLLFCYSSNAQNSTTYKLQTAIDVALINNNTVKQKELQVQTARTNYNQSRFNRLPSISGDISYGISNGRSIDPFTNTYNNQRLSSSNGSATAVLPIFNGFQISNSIKQNEFNHSAAKFESQQEKDNLLLNVIVAFLQVVNNEDVLALGKKQALVTKKQMERLETLNREGAIAPSLLSDMQGQYATDQLNIVNAENTLETSKLSLTQLMNMPYSREIKIDREGIDVTMDTYTKMPAEIYDTALNKLAMVKAADLRYKAANKGIKVASAAYYPTLSLFGQLNSNYSSAARIFNATTTNEVPTGDYVIVGGANIPVITRQTNFNDKKISYLSQLDQNLNTYYGVSLQIPIFSAFKNRSNVSLARIEARNAALVADNTRIQLKQAIEQAYIDMSSANDRYKVLQEQVKAFTESFHAAEIKFESGVINSVEYLIIKNNLDRASINLTVARYEYLLRSKVLDFYQGNLKKNR
ncbi:MAG: TolC family protein [Ferruginibacter sp.]